LVVDWNGNQLGGERAKHRAHDGVTGVLQTDSFPRINQNSNSKIQSMLNASHDNHPVWRAANTASTAEIIRNGLAQRPIAVRIGIRE
jgi:hypothetical protein